MTTTTAKRVDDAAIVRTMRQALALAAKGPARGINPRVGCVILNSDGETISVGWHRGAGTAHAEADALSKLEPGAAVGATAVVTLEPCNHIGRTGPCSEALIEAGISRVVYAVPDPNERAAGGAERLREAGVEVDGDLLRSEAEQFLGDWLQSARLGRPIVTIKWAASLDGRAAASDGTSQWITGAEARNDVHRRRSLADAIAVGTGTMIADDPSLSARNPDGTLMEHQPVPVVFGRTTTPTDAAMRSDGREPLSFTGADLAADLHALHARGIRTLFVEGGPRLASAFLEAGLVDEVVAYVAPVLLGGPRTAIRDIGVDTISQALRLSFDTVELLGDDVLLVAHPRRATGFHPDERN